MIKSQSFLNSFAMLGDSWEINDDSISLAEEYLCWVYDEKKKTTTVNHVRFECFSRSILLKYVEENKSSHEMLIKINNTKGEVLCIIWLL